MKNTASFFYSQEVILVHILVYNFQYFTMHRYFLDKSRVFWYALVFSNCQNFMNLFSGHQNKEYKFLNSSYFIQLSNSFAAAQQTSTLENAFKQ